MINIEYQGKYPFLRMSTNFLFNILNLLSNRLPFKQCIPKTKLS